MPQEPRPALAMWLQINLTALVVLMAGQGGTWPGQQGQCWRRPRGER